MVLQALCLFSNEEENSTVSEIGLLMMSKRLFVIFVPVIYVIDNFGTNELTSSVTVITIQ